MSFRQLPATREDRQGGYRTFEMIALFRDLELRLRKKATMELILTHPDFVETTMRREIDHHVMKLSCR